jgi:hypothetical protein
LDLAAIVLSVFVIVGGARLESALILGGVLMLVASVIALGVCSSSTPTRPGARALRPVQGHGQVQRVLLDEPVHGQEARLAAGPQPEWREDQGQRQGGEPIQIAAVVVWQVEDTYRASFDVEHFESYVLIQSEAALRHLAGIYPYDTFEDGAEEKMTLRAGAERVSEELERELSERFARAGIRIVEARLSHLAYSPRSPRRC